ncbi:RHS repeat-associated core domain-containing protein [Caballeronia sp. PC1]|uniref:RHS repeat-associated core domain-containing protein n=1 Tax=Caballeronia sp. PC1 TaxID=2906765 RepID=UPI0035C7E1ED
MHYNRRRYYDPATGRFISKDPIGLKGRLNAFAYAPNPLSWIDPLGLSKCVFRGDARSPDMNFKEGFKLLGNNTDLFNYALKSEPSVFVSASKCPNVVREFAD